MPTRAWRWYRMLSNNDFELIMDDEKYFLLQDQSAPTNRGLYTSDKRTTAPQIKFKRTQKFEPKILVWIATSEKWISKPFFSKQKQAVSQTTYLNWCIIVRLIPFIKSQHNKEKVLFWPDLASSHYGHDVLRYLNENDVQFVDEEFNPQARPIETLWSILKNMVYDEGWDIWYVISISRKLKSVSFQDIQRKWSSVSLEDILVIIDIMGIMAERTIVDIMHIVAIKNIYWKRLASKFIKLFPLWNYFKLSKFWRLCLSNFGLGLRGMTIILTILRYLKLMGKDQTLRKFNHNFKSSFAFPTTYVNYVKYYMVNNIKYVHYAHYGDYAHYVHYADYADYAHCAHRAHKSLL